MADHAISGEKLPAARPRPGSVEKLARPMPWGKATVVRQLAVLVALSLAISIGVAVALWSKDPNYTPVFSELGHDDVVKITEALKIGEVPFRIDQSSGVILVPSSRIRDVRMQLASQGLPRGSATGLEILGEEQDLSTSQFIEAARYNHALEIELARSISTLKNIKAARVHLALPKQSIFVRKRVKSSASVVVSLQPGRVLERGQVASIVHLVSSSIANMESGQVTVIDQLGRLLTEDENNVNIALSASQFDYQRKLERDYSERIVNLLEPIIGYGKVRAQVAAELNFSQLESTEEVFDPDQKDRRQLVRSEQTSEEQNRLDRATGVPGALSNQPPGAGTTDPDSANVDSTSPKSLSRAETRNYEMDRVIRHKRSSSGNIERLSVAVIIDDKVVSIEPRLPVDGKNISDSGDSVEEQNAEPATDQDAAEGANADENNASEQTAVNNARATTKRVPYSEAEIEKLTGLVREVIAFNTARGDTIKVMNSSFIVPQIEEIPELPIWEQVWLQDLVKQVLSGIFILLLLLLIVRPIVRGLIPIAGDVYEEDVDMQVDNEQHGLSEDPLSGALDEGDIVWGSDGRPIDPEADANKMQFSKKLDYARILTLEDPGRAAQVMKAWMNEGAEEKEAA